MQKLWNKKFKGTLHNLSQLTNLYLAIESRIKNLDVGKPYVVMNTTAGHKEQFSDYDPDAIRKLEAAF